MGYWLSQYAFVAIDLVKFAATDFHGKTVFLNATKSVLGVVNIGSVITVAVLQGQELDKTNPLAKTQYALTIVGRLSGSILKVIAVAKMPTVKAIKTAGKPYGVPAAFGAVATYDIVTTGFFTTLYSANTFVQLGDFVKNKRVSRGLLLRAED